MKLAAYCLNTRISNQIYAGLFDLNGFKFLLASGNVDSTSIELESKEGTVKRLGLIRRPRRIDFKSHFIAFSWKSPISE